jgi:hypothetical protein
MTGWSTIDYAITDWLAFQLPRQKAFVRIFYVPPYIQLDVDYKSAKSQRMWPNAYSAVSLKPEPKL